MVSHQEQDLQSGAWQPYLKPVECAICGTDTCLTLRFTRPVQGDAHEVLFERAMGRERAPEVMVTFYESTRTDDCFQTVIAFCSRACKETPMARRKILHELNTPGFFVDISTRDELLDQIDRAAQTGEDAPALCTERYEFTLAELLDHFNLEIKPRY